MKQSNELCSVLPSGIFEYTDGDQKINDAYITATCTKKAIHNTFGGWVLDPPLEGIDFKCVPMGMCENQRGTPPIPIEENDRKVVFAPFDDFLEEPLLQFGPVEMGGNIVAYCKGVGQLKH